MKDSLRCDPPRGLLRASLLAAAAGLAAACVFGGRGVSPFEPEARRLGIVMPFAYKGADKSLDEAPRVLADQLTRAIFDTKRMRVIDPARLEAQLKDMKLPVGVPLDAGTMAAVCSKLKAETAVFGSIPVAVKETAAASRVRETLTVQVEATLVLCSTTEVFSSARAKATVSTSYRPDHPPAPELLLKEALTRTSKDLALQLVRELQPR